MSSNAEAVVDVGPERVGDRYRVEAELGRGGAAHVYRVLDERSGEQLALKKLVAPPERSANLQVMFEREYHALAQLEHPRIVRVFDYGLDDGKPFYTMELLRGADARTTFRADVLSVPHACMLLRDVASALALIHSRRFVHRDISPRNLWCTPDGRGKLIDFGTLVAMGPQTRIAGTPPFVAPESVYLQPLEARSDIYSLGALAYFLLTKRNAYPAREISDLRELWHRTPLRPEQIREDLPSALGDLIMSLLSLDPRARPASAAEVYERLTAIGQLAPDDERLAAQAFLTSPQLVGRNESVSLLRKRLLRATRGKGGTAAIVARAGLGRSRLLDAFVLEAKLAGATVVSLFASAVGSGPYALAGALAERVLELLPMIGPAMIDSAPVLAQLSPALNAVFGDPPKPVLSPQERTQRTSAALVKLIEAAAARQPMVLAIDDVHRADSASLGVLGRVSVRAGDRPLLLVTTVEAGTLADPPPALEQLAYTRDRIVLGALESSDTHALLESLFGAVSGLDEAARWLHELSQGSPAACMQYAQHLVDQGIARYEQGRWELPARLRDRGLPATLDAMFEARLARLEPDARALALGMALARDESRSIWQPENHVRIEDFPRLLGSDDAGRSFAALDELLQAGVLQQRDSYYVLAQRALVDVLLRVSDESARRAAHLRVAEVFMKPGYPPFMGLRQLQLAGEQERARALLLESMVKLQTTSMDWGTMRVSVSTECCRRALDHWKEQGGSPYEGIMLRRLLVLTSSVYDWGLAQEGAAQIAQLQRDCALDHYEHTDPALSAVERVIECLKLAQQRYDAAPESERGFAPTEAVRELSSAAMPLSGAAVHSHDVAMARSLPPVLAPLRPLSPLIGLLADSCDVAVQRVTGRDFGSKLADSIQAIMATTLPEVLRLGAAAVNCHIQCVEDARCGRARGLEVIGRLAASAGDDLFLVLHGRWLAHAFGGNAPLAERLRRQAEVITEDDVWRRRSFLFAEAELWALTGNLTGLRRTVDAIALLAERFPGWRPWLGYALAALHRLRGQEDKAQAELDGALLLAQPGEHRAWTRLAPARAELLLAREPEAALRECDAILEAVESLKLDRWTEVAGQRIRALAQSALGHHVPARVSLERAFALAYEQGFGGLPLALLHEARARVALAAQEAEECTTALETLRAAIELADAPALVAAYESLREESSRRLPASDVPAALTSSTIAPTDTSTTYSEVRTRMSTCTERRDRARQALELLIEDSGAPGGHLFLFDAGGLFTAASHPGFANEQVLRVAQQYLETQREETKTAVVTTAQVGPHYRMAVARNEEQLVPALIGETNDGRRVLTGVALLATRDGTVRMPREALVHAISRCLLSAGDSMPFAIDD